MRTVLVPHPVVAAVLFAARRKLGLLHDHLVMVQIHLVVEQSREGAHNAAAVADPVVDVLLVRVGRQPDDGLRLRRLRNVPHQPNLLGGEEPTHNQHPVALELLDLVHRRFKARPAGNHGSRHDGGGAAAAGS